MAGLMMRSKWTIIRTFSRQRGELLILIFIFMILTLIVMSVWEASQPIDGTYIDFSEKHQYELIEKYKKQRDLLSKLKKKQQELNNEAGINVDNDKYFNDRVGIHKDAQIKETDFNASKHLRENLHVISERKKYDAAKDMKPNARYTANPGVPVVVQKKQKMIKYYDPNQGRMVYKPVIEEETELVGGPGQCRVYDLSTNLTERFDCMTLSIKPYTPICLYPNEQDIHISAHIRDEGIWEPHIVRDFQNILYGDADLNVIDIGANIGQYSLLAAAMGHKVIAVEPSSENIKRLQKAAQIGNLTDKITVVQNAISDTRKIYYLRMDPENQGGVSLQMENPNPDCYEKSCRAQTITTIHMDDLLEVTTFNKAIMKIDIEGHEHRAFLHSQQFLKKVYVPYIFMEWMKLRQYHGSEVTQNEDKTLTQRLVNYLSDLGYIPYSSVTMEKLNKEWWVAWTDDIIWKHELHELA